MEARKFRYQIAEDKLLLFAAMVGASATGLTASRNIFSDAIFFVGFVIGTIGAIANLAKIATIEKELESVRDSRSHLFRPCHDTLLS